MSDTDEAKRHRRESMTRALASASIEGHVPSAAFLADVEAYIEGTITDDEMGARSLARARASEAAATASAKGPNHDQERD